jgi:maltose/moltooligosaccharide transporter
MQSMFIGLGAIIASALPWIFTNLIGISTETLPGQIPTNVRWSFYLGAFAFLGAVLYTIFSTKEYPPADMQAFEAEQKAAQAESLISRVSKATSEIFDAIFHMPKVMRQLALVQFLTWPGLFLMWFYFGVGTTRQVFKYVDYKAGETEYAAYLESKEKGTTYILDSELSQKYGTVDAFATDMEQKVLTNFGSGAAFIS